MSAIPEEAAEGCPHGAHAALVAAKIERQHRAGRMTARERIAALLAPGTPFLEIGLLPAYDQCDGEAPERPAPLAEVPD